MYIEEKDGIIKTSENHFIKKSDINRVQYSEDYIKTNRFLVATLNGVPDQKVFYKPDHYSRDNTPNYDYTPENRDLYPSDKQRDEFRKTINKLKDGEEMAEYSKSAYYTMFDKDNNEIGSHKYTKTYSDRMYLLGQWSLSRRDIENFGYDLLLPTPPEKPLPSKTTVKD